MKRLKVLISLLLVAALFVTLFAACAENEQPTTNNDNPTSNNDTPANNEDSNTDADKPADNDVQDAPADTDTEDPADTEPVDSIKDRLGDDWDYEIETLVFYLLDDSGKNAGNEVHLEEAMNDYLGQYGINIDIRFGGYGTYPTYLTMDLYSGATVDVAMMYPGREGNFLGMYSENLLLEIGDLLEQYAPETLELMGDYMGAVTYNGGVWGVPGLRSFASSPYLIMRGDIVTELGLEDAVRNCTNWSDMEKIWDQIKAADPDMYPVGGGTNTAANVFYGDSIVFAEAVTVDLADRLGSVAIIDDVAQCLYATDLYVKDAQRAAEWLEKGYIYPDAIHTQSLPDELLGGGAVASYITNSEIGLEATKEANLGIDLVCVQVGEGMVSGGGLQRFGVTVPNTAECPEKAVFFINLMYTDPVIANMIAWGVEGTDYVVKNGEACYPDSGEALYHNRDFLLGNQFICLPWEGQGADFRQVAEELNKKSPVSEYLTFSLDTNGLDDQIANLTAVVDEFHTRIVGGYYTEQLHSDFMAKLEVAGIDNMVDEVQKQLDAWLAAN